MSEVILMDTIAGPMNCIPKLTRGATLPRTVMTPNGYTKRHGDHTTHPLPSDKRERPAK